jgi:hypothetical protein
MEAEIIAALTGITGVASLKASASAEDLLAKEGIQKPAIGVTDAGAEWKESLGVGQKQQRGAFRWEITILVESGRGRIDARSTLRTLRETVRDRLHYLKSTIPLKARYMWRGDQPLDIGRPDVLGSVTSFELDALVGN